jgi:hypothetical protein
VVPGSSATYRLQLVTATENDDGTSRIETTTTGTTGHLRVLSRKKVAERHTVVLADAREDDALGGHVDSHGKRLCGEQDLNQAAGEQDFNHL